MRARLLLGLVGALAVAATLYVLQHRDNGRGGGGGTSITLVSIGRFAEPTYVTAPPGDRQRVFVAERAGRIRLVSRGRKRRRPFLDISSQVSTSGERGFLSMAFAPDYEFSGRVYVFYTDMHGDVRVDEFRRDGTGEHLDPDTQRHVLFVEHSRYESHNGGQLQFGPDGLLYISVGDGGEAGDPKRNSQNLRSLLGKLIRIDPVGRGYEIPFDNPFAGLPLAYDPYGGGLPVAPEIYAYGLRNPWRFSFDGPTGELVIADVGRTLREEVNIRSRTAVGGANFGANCVEGSVDDPATDCNPIGDTLPVLDYSHAWGCAVIGGYVVRDPSLGWLDGRYVYGDYCTGELRSAVLRPGGAREDRSMGLGVGPASLTSFGQDACGHVYVAARRPGLVYRIEGPGTRPCHERSATPADGRPLPRERPSSLQAPLAADPAATVAGDSISRATVDRWTVVAAAAYEPTGIEQRRAPPDPPDFTRCVAGKRRGSPDTRTPREQARLDRLRAECRREYRAQRTEALRFLITAKWVEGEASEHGVTVSDEEVKKRLARTLPPVGVEARSRELLGRWGMTEADARFRAKVDLLASKLRDKETARTGQVSNAEVEDYYEDNTQRFTLPERRDLLAVVTASEVEAQRTKSAIEAGESFERIARRVSIDDASRAQGGKLPGAVRGQAERALEEAIFGVRANQLEGPVSTALGWYVFKVTKVSGGVVQPLAADVASTIRQELATRKEHAALEAFRKRLFQKWRERTECAAGLALPECKRA